MAALLRHYYRAAKRFGGLALHLQHEHHPTQAAERGHRPVPRFMHTKQRAHDEITRDIQRKQRDLRDVIDEGRRSLKAAPNWREQQRLLDAVAEARTSLMEATAWCNEEFLDQFKSLKPHQRFWEYVKVFFMVAEGIRKLIVIVFVTTLLVMFACAGWEVRKTEKEREEAAKKKKGVQ